MIAAAAPPPVARAIGPGPIQRIPHREEAQHQQFHCQIQSPQRRRSTPCREGTAGSPRTTRPCRAATARGAARRVHVLGVGHPDRRAAAARTDFMTRAGPAVLLALASVACVAQDADLLHAPACRRAMDALEAREAAAAKERGAAQRAALEAARREAASACLGGRGSAASAPPRAAQPAAKAGPPAHTVPAAPRATPTAVPAPAPRPAPPPLTISACDATGCWASDSTRLQRAGPNLLGSTGVCTTSGPFVQCPP